jgi:hypothetical protein
VPLVVVWTLRRDMTLRGREDLPGHPVILRPGRGDTGNAPRTRCKMTARPGVQRSAAGSMTRVPVTGIADRPDQDDSSVRAEVLLMEAEHPGRFDTLPNNR